MLGSALPFVGNFYMHLIVFAIFKYRSNIKYKYKPFCDFQLKYKYAKNSVFNYKYIFEPNPGATCARQ